MKISVRFSVLILALCLSLPVLGMSLEAAKQALDAVKQKGLAGETPSGYLQTVKPDQHAEEVVKAINEARRDEYARIAQNHNIPVTQVETVAGKKAIEQTPAGQFVLKDGNWVKK
ncbi:MAG: hypothetical protein CL583_06580 [Alteromonadaceae bacterium]|nr:hypothetical protein [Alteromonadaceae bacterium]|tara:strand:+ start:3561 stop:3905 length:345 start_codon:yes stop_codon:yes gene_type:complete